MSSVHGEDPPSETIEMNCFDPTCETPFLRGELIVDLPQFSLSKGTQAQVIAQSPDFYRIKVGDAIYDIPFSVLNIHAHIHEGRELWRAQLPLINPPISISAPLSEPEQKAESPASPNLDLMEEELPAPQYKPPKKDKKEESSGPKESLNSNSPPLPSIEQRMSKSNDNEVTLDNKNSQKTPTESFVEPFMEQSHKVEIEITSSSEIKQPEKNSGIKMQPKVKEQNIVKSTENGSEAEPKLTPASVTKTMPQSQENVGKRRHEEQLHVIEIEPEVNPAPEIKAVDMKLPPEKNPNFEDIKSVEILKQSSVETASKPEETKQVKNQPGVEEVHAQYPKVVEPVTQPPSIESIVKVEEIDKAHTSTSGSAQQHTRVESVTKADEKAPFVKTSKVEEAKTLAIPEIDPVSQVKTIPEIEDIGATSVPEFQQTSDQPFEQAPPKVERFKEIPKDESLSEIPNQNDSVSNLLPELKESSKSTPESERSVQPPVENTIEEPKIHDATAQTQLSDELEMSRDELLPTSPPLLDIANESIFFHCLSLAANGTFNGEKSLVAALILSIARRYFIVAQTLLGELPHGLVSPLHSLFTFTFKMPLVFFISWTLFITSVVVTYLVIKLTNKLLLLGFSSTNIDDPTQRSLSQWLAVEENANLLADSLADKEEAYGRLIVWSTKVSERYENQNRHATTSSTHIHNQLRDTKAALTESLKENKELKDTHDALVEQLSTVKNEATFNTTHLREEINTLNKRLEECTRQYGESIAEKERLNEEIVSKLRDEKAVLVSEVKSYQSQVESAEKTMSELKEASRRFEEDLAIRDRELLNVKEAFMEFKVAELRNKNKKAVTSPITPKAKASDDGASVDGWEVEDAELNAIIGVEGGHQGEEEELNESDLQSAFDSLKEVGRLKVALEEAEKLAHNAASAKDQETKLRVELEEKIDSLESEIEEMRQKLRTATEKFEASETKLEVLSDYFHKREAERQKDLGRKELSQSEMSEEISLLREKLRTAEVEINTLREQLSSARRELAETERSNRRHVSELDKRLHENRLASRSLENQVKDLRAENGMLRQKIFVGDRLGVFPPGILPPPPPPPPPPQVLSLAASKLPENRSISRQLEKSPSSHLAQVNLQQQIPPPFLPFALAGPGGSPFIPPPPPPLGMMSPSLLNTQINPTRSGQRPGSTTSGSNRSGKQPH
nr:hypothetical protein HmN_000463700 [Hymenolepis microstoma]